MTARPPALVLVSTALFLAGCATPSPAHRPPDDGTGPPPSSARAAEVSVTGTVEAGIEPGCLVLATGDRPYLLIGGDRAALRPGARVVVRGVPQPDLATTCMQGLPLQAREVRPAG